MPWSKKQATAILIKAKRSGDKALERKAKSYLGDGMGDKMMAAAKPRKPKVVELRTRTPMSAGDSFHIDAPMTRALTRSSGGNPKARVGGFWRLDRKGRLGFDGT